MKFWQKICLFSILTFVIIFNAASIMVIERNHSKMLQQEINNTLSANMSINSSVNAVVPILRIYDSIDYEKTVLTNIANEFVRRNSDQGSYLEIADDKDKTVFSNLDFVMPAARDERKELEPGEIKYILRDIDERTLLFTANVTDINQKSYIFTYIKDVTPLYTERMDQYTFFAQMDIVACLIYIIVMFFISKGLTKPIETMVRTAKEIAQGDFSERVQLKSRDEIGVLATNFNEMAAVVEDKINELERNNGEKQRFINNITHELKTPLTSIIGYANYMRSTKYDEATFLEGLNAIYSEGKRLEALATKLMDLILLKDHQFQMKPDNLKDVVMELEPSLKHIVAAKQIRLELACADCRLPLEKDLIKIVIFNLVDNAVKASSEGGKITIRTLERSGSCVLEVADEGSGISREHMDKIFEPFYMADKARTRNNNGAGLGLSICRSIASIHHAVIEVDSEVQMGTAIRIVFPQPQEGSEVNP
ncbi:sensor histidine kinase [Paenibacillus sp. 1011MAR3C5]|uniref:sensor histidine kinase n=1 Tax=Paenibacillus sp. 1011MAR3C5 TaxID=1675787 RepID=UPI000E6B84D7|nr:HAMP domain-containing sensor histidine kinase [Paenibacillus sp. 1011MAR3C5]RJE88438.1 sensor histidine kinase [Paenibacillus sp. 1011MAR3C5]